MKPVVGIFTSRAEAERATEQLRNAGIADRYVNFLHPGQPVEPHVPTSETEQEGMGSAIGGVVGGAVGAAAGIQIGAAAASVLIPGVGPVIGIGLAAAAILGAGGAVGGAMAGKAIEEHTTEGIAADELFFYEDALRQGRSVLIAFAEDEDQATQVRTILADSGAESLDAARDAWWIGLRSAEREEYCPDAGDCHDPDYRRGYEAALHPSTRGKSYREAQTYLSSQCPESWNTALFRRGYERGQKYAERLLASRN